MEAGLLAPEDRPPLQEAGVVLLVDDEPNILAALRRLFRRDGHRLLTATGGAEALQVLEREGVDVVISDMRMPGMDGAAFLEQVAARWPGTVRILLTGYADLGSAVAAVNRAGIHRYLSKPWDDEELRRTVREALERKRLEQERRRLERLTYRQNEQLQELNARLEEKVAERTRELGRPTPPCARPIATPWRSSPACWSCAPRGRRPTRAGWRRWAGIWPGPWAWASGSGRTCTWPGCCTTSARSPCPTPCCSGRTTP